MAKSNGKVREGSFFKKLIKSKKPKESINGEKEQNKDKEPTTNQNQVIENKTIDNPNQPKLPVEKVDTKNPGLKGGGSKSKSKRKAEAQTSKSDVENEPSAGSGSAGLGSGSGSGKSENSNSTEVSRYEENEGSSASASRKSGSKMRNSKDYSKSTYYTYGSYYTDSSKGSDYKTSNEEEDKKPPAAEDNDMCKNGKPYMAIGSEEGKGIFFKIPGKVTHKTTIRIASFPGCCPPPCCCTGGNGNNGGNVVEEGKELEIEELIPSDIAARTLMPQLTPGPCPSPCCPSPYSMQLTPSPCHKTCEKETFLNNCNINYGPPPGVSPFAGGFGSFSQHMPTRPVMANMSSSTCGGSPQPRNYNYNYYLPGYQQQQPQQQQSYYPQNCYNQSYYR